MDRLVQNLSVVATLNPVRASLRERSPGVWQVRVSGVGPGTSLGAKASEAQSDVAAYNPAGAWGVLAAFIHEVNSQAGKSISTSTAASLIAWAARIRAVLGC
jgi:hypothetical protein